MSDLDPRFPIGRPDVRAPLTPDERVAMIDRIAGMPDRMRDALSGLGDAQLDTPYREGGWTVRQVVHHVPDSHMNGYIRFKLTVTEDRPALKNYEEQIWAELPDGRTADVELSLPILESVHRRWVAFLRDLDDAAFERVAIYSDGSEKVLDELLCIYSWHGDHHVAHITSLRDRMGW